MTNSWPLLVCIGIVGVTLRYLLKPTKFKDVPKPPTPSWLWGHTRKVHTTSAGDHYGVWIDSYGPTIKLDGSLGTEEYLVSADPALIHHVFTTNCYDYTKSKFARRFFERVLGQGLVWAEGDMHKAQRRQLAGAFSQDTVNRMEPAVTEIVHKMVNIISTMVDQGQDVVDVHDMVTKATFDAFGSVALNHEFNALEGGAADIRQKWRDLGNGHIGLGGLMVVSALRAFPWFEHLPFAAIQDHGSVRTTINPVAQAIIAAAESNQAVSESAKKDNDLLSILLRSGDMPKEQLIDNISTFIMAGFDTTAAVLTWALYALAEFTATQDKLREELLRFGREPTVKDLASMDQLPYFDAVCKETLRMFASTDAERVALKDDVLPLRFPITTPDGRQVNEVVIRKGETIIIPLICSNRLNAVWGDGAQWRPERWLEGEKMPSKRDLPAGWSNMMTFSEGPRLCIGHRLAIMELKIFLAALIKRFTFELPSTDFDVEGKFFVSLWPYVKGEEDKGAYLPLRLKVYDQE
ncbi:cytochrome P450 [Mycena epipterygia]|nr:cytochrome P450 [Mycena epipterygia]